jgi:hypothetical protein
LTTARYRYITITPLAISIEGTFSRYVASLYIGVRKMKRTKVILLLLMGCMMLSGLACGESGEELYNADRELIEMAVGNHMSGPHDVAVWWPIQDPNEEGLVGGEDIKGPDIVAGAKYYTVAICPLLIKASPKGILEAVPQSCDSKNCADSPPGGNGTWYQGNEGENTAERLSVSCNGHYRWLCTSNCDIASICIGDECRANDEDGYQGVYP